MVVIRSHYINSDAGLGGESTRAPRSPVHLQLPECTNARKVPPGGVRNTRLNRCAGQNHPSAALVNIDVAQDFP